MKLTSVDDLVQSDVLAEDVLTLDYKVLLSKGTILSDDYISLLKRNGIRSVYLKDEVSAEEVAILKDDVQEEIHETLQSILEKHTYSNTKELSELCDTADVIISNILEEEDVVDKLYDIKQRSADIYEHSISVCSIATLIALKNKLSREMVHDIGVACLLHELGLRYLTISYENREIFDMDEMEATEYKKHPIYAYTALQDEKWLSEEAKQMILYHHERMDGTGYPMKANELPIQCKIIQVCDVFDEYICGIGCERVKVYEALVKGVADNALAMNFHTSPETLCAACHHNVPVADLKQPSKCSACHGSQQDKMVADKNIPSLKAAYHQQCIACHTRMAVKPVAQDCAGCHEKAAR